jgi:hypothetical protein
VEPGSIQTVFFFRSSDTSEEPPLGLIAINMRGKARRIVPRMSNGGELIISKRLNSDLELGST